MAQSVPKQYLMIGGHPLLWYALRALCTHPSVRRTFVVLHPADQLFAQCDWSAFGDRLVPLFCGGATRAESVRLGLERMQAHVSERDWVLVHDAARPCLSRLLVDRLMTDLSEDETGGLLAIPLADTLKRTDDGQRVLYTEPRDHLWQAQTPQMFRFSALLGALRDADPARTNDEASAMERVGYRPRLVMGSVANLKVTHPEDLLPVERILAGDLA